MRAFNSLSAYQKRVIEGLFILPEDTSKVYLDDFNRPFETISGAKVVCTVINKSFHIHENKNR